MRCNGFAHLPVKEKAVGSTPITAAKLGRSTIGVVSRLENGVGASLGGSNPSPSATIKIKVEPYDWAESLTADQWVVCPVCNEMARGCPKFFRIIREQAGVRMWTMACKMGCLIKAMKAAKGSEDSFREVRNF